MGTEEEFAEARPGVAGHIQAAKRVEFHSDGLVFGVGYAGNGPSQTTDGSDYLPLAAPGNRLPHRWIRAGESLFDRLGPGFTVIGAARDTAGLVRCAARRGIPLATLDEPGLGLQDLLGTPIVLVRPDQHIAWMGDDLPEAAADGVLDRAVRGFPARETP